MDHNELRRRAGILEEEVTPTSKLVAIDLGKIFKATRGNLSTLRDVVSGLYDNLDTREKKIVASFLDQLGSASQKLRDGDSEDG